MARPLLVTVNGTGVPDPFGPGFPGDIGKWFANPWNDILAEFRGPEFANLYEWQPIGYPAATVQMGPSVDIGRNNTVDQILRRPRGTKTILSGYSQGALVTDEVWRDEYLSPSGRLHDRQDDVIGIINFGDPMRCPGISNGNKVAGFPVPGKLNGFTTGGIAGPDCLTPEQTPDFLLSCNNPGDLYGTAPVGDKPWETETGVGHDETLIFNLIQDFDGKNLLALAEEAADILGVVLTGGLSITSLLTTGTSAIAGAFGNTMGIPGLGKDGIKDANALVSVILALMNGGMFVLRGLGPHGDYAKMVAPLIDWVTTRAKL